MLRTPAPLIGALGITRNRVEGPLSQDSVADLKEGELIRRLLAERHWRERILNIKGIPDGATPLLEVELDDLGKRGDIDILLVHPSQPEKATAIQAKRLKVGPRAFISGKPNRFKDIKKLYEQTNLVLDLGFWQTFSFLFIVVDSRIRNLGKMQYDGVTTGLRETIDRNLDGNGLRPEAGLVIVEITQPMNDRPLGAGTSSIQCRRLPCERSQPRNVTQWVIKKLAESDA